MESIIVSHKSGAEWYNSDRETPYTWGPSPSGNVIYTPVQCILVWAPSHSDPVTGRVWKGCVHHRVDATRTDAIPCEPSFDESEAAEAAAKAKRDAKARRDAKAKARRDAKASRDAEIEAKAKAKKAYGQRKFKQAQEAAAEAAVEAARKKEEEKRNFEASLPIVGAFAEEDVLDYNGDWDLE